MDWLTFISKVIASLAWPGALVVVLLIVKKELPALARSLRKFKFKDVELEFGEGAKAVASEAKEVVPVKPNVPLAGRSKEDLVNRLYMFTEFAPRAAIIEAWLVVEGAAVALVQKRSGKPLTSMPGPMRLRDSLVRAEVLNSKQIEVFESLRTLRNQAVHYPDADFTQESVRSYVDAALTMAAYLESLIAEI